MYKNPFHILLILGLFLGFTTWAQDRQWHVQTQAGEALVFQSILIVNGMDSTWTQTDSLGNFQNPAYSLESQILLWPQGLPPLPSPWENDTLNFPARYDLLPAVDLITYREAPMQWAFSTALTNSSQSLQHSDPTAWLLREGLFQSNYSNGLSAELSYLGLSGSYINVLVNGVPLPRNLQGQVDLNSISLDQIESIRITEGANGFQNNNSAAGVTIDIKTQRLEGKQAAKFSLGLYSETVGQNRAHLQGQGTWSDNFSYQLGISGAYFDGWHAKDNFWGYSNRYRNPSERFKHWKPRSQTNLNGQLHYQEGKHEAAFTFLSLSNTIYDLGMPLGQPAAASIDHHYQNRSQQAGLNYSITQKGSHSIQVKYNRMENVQQQFYTKFVDASRTLKSQSNQSNRTTKIAYDFSGKLGNNGFIKPYLQWESNAIQSQLIGNKEEHLMQWKAGLNYRLKANQYWQFNTTLAQALHNRFAPQTLFAIQGTRSLKRKTFNFELAKGFKYPEANELFFEFVDFNHRIYGNTNLAPEKSFNTSAELKTQKWKFRVQHTRIENQIALLPINGLAYQYFNLVARDILLGQIRFHQQTRQLHWTNQLNIQYNHWTLSSNQRESGMAISLNSDWTYKPDFTPLQFGINYQWISKQVQIATTAEGQLTPFEIPTQHWLSAHISSNNLWQKMEMAFGVKNIFNQQNIPTENLPNIPHVSGQGLFFGYGTSLFIKINYHVTL